MRGCSDLALAMDRKPPLSHFSFSETLIKEIFSVPIGDFFHSVHESLKRPEQRLTQMWGRCLALDQSLCRAATLSPLIDQLMESKFFTRCLDNRKQIFVISNSFQFQSTNVKHLLVSS